MTMRLPESMLEYRRCEEGNFKEGEFLALLKCFGLRTQSSLSNRDVYLGVLLYLSALEMPDMAQRMEWMQQAVIRHGSYHATLYMIGRCLEQMEEAVFRLTEPVSREELNRHYEELQQYFPVLQKHQTPGFILMTNCYLWLDWMDQKIPNLPSENRPDYLYNAMLCISMAEVLEKASEAEIYNAYGDRGLGAGNTYEVSSIEKMARHVYGLFGAHHNTLEYSLEYFQTGALHTIKNERSRL